MEKNELRKIIQEALNPILKNDYSKENRGTFIENEGFEQEESKLEALTVEDDLNNQDQNRQV